MENSKNKNQTSMVEVVSTRTVSNERKVIEMGQVSTLTLGSWQGTRNETYRFGTWY